MPCFMLDTKLCNKIDKIDHLKSKFDFYIRLDRLFILYMNHC